MIHVMTDEWSIGSFTGQIYMPKIWSYIKSHKIRPEDVELSLISHKPLEVDIMSARYQLASPEFPLTIVDGMPNPHNKRYRMIDGRHRLHKLLPCNFVYCHVIPYEIAMYYAEPITYK